MGDGVRWLDADERRIWLGWIMSTRLLWEEVERDLQRDSGLSFGHYEILVMLSETPGRSRRMSELADATQSSRSRLSHAVARLEELGWVRREACAEDRRGSLAVLTDEGFAALEAAAPLHVESVRRHLFDLLSPRQLTAAARDRGGLARSPAAPGRGAWRRALEADGRSTCPARPLTARRPSCSSAWRDGRADRSRAAAREPAPLLHRRREHVARLRLDLHAARRPARPLRLHRGPARA